MGAISTAVAARDEAETGTPRAFVMRYSNELTNVMPTHLTSQSDAWLRLSTGALKTGKLAPGGDGLFELEVAALNNPAAFMQALRKAASMGLQPGTEQYYLTARPNGKNGGRLEILGIVGYQGYVELMYRSGKVAKVVVDTVHENDGWQFDNNYDERPHHQIDYRRKATDEELKTKYGHRGDIQLAYAYVVFKNGFTSDVIVLDEFEISRIKKKSSSAKFDSSPWNTDTKAMWKKSAIRRLVPLVPTSVEILGPDGLPAAPQVPQLPAGAAHAALQHAQPPAISPDALKVQLTDDDDHIDAESEEVPPAAETVPDEAQGVVEAEVVPDPVPPAQEPAPAGEQAPAAPAPEPQRPAVTLSTGQYKRLMNLFARNTITEEAEQIEFVKGVIGVTVETMKILTPPEANTCISALEAKLKASQDPEKDLAEAAKGAH
jgi:recombination protein RecT